MSKSPTIWPNGQAYFNFDLNDDTFGQPVAYAWQQGNTSDVVKTGPYNAETPMAICKGPSTPEGRQTIGQ